MMNHSAPPSDPATMAPGWLFLMGMVNNENAPAVVMRPIRFTLYAGNQRAPSDPVVMLPRPVSSVEYDDHAEGPGSGDPSDPGSRKSPVNQRAPSIDPVVMLPRPLAGVGTVYSLKVPALVIRPILLVVLSVNHTAPSGPAVMPVSPLSEVGTVYSLKTPAVVMRPILFA